MDHQALVEKFAQTVGVEKAESLIEDARADLGIDRDDEYTPTEVADICDAVQASSEGYLQLVANEIRIQQQAQRRFDALLDEITDPVVTVTFEDSAPIVRATNPAFDETFGYGAAAIGEPLAELIYPEDADERPADLWFRSDADAGIEVQRRTADGERRTFLFRPVVATREGGTVEGYGIYTDITERKRRERALEVQNEQLERFASVVSHDLRNPLSIAEGSLELARRSVSDPEAEEHLRRVADAHARMNDLIDHLLELATQGQAVDDPAPVRLLDVARTAWNGVDTEDARLVVDCPSSLTVAADEERLRQLLENLLRNSVEHASTGDGASDPPDDAALVLGAEDPAVTVRVGWDDGTLYVEDDGPGIPAEDREDVLEYGYSTTADGTGFGLAIVETIAEAHDWSVEVTEARTGGARFEFAGVATAD